MSITAQVVDGIAETIECLLDVRAPVLAIEGVTEFIPGIRVAEFQAGIRERKLSVFVESVDGSKKLALELITEDKDRDKERTFGKTKFTVRGDATAGNNAVHVNMIVKLLIPGVKDLDYTRGCTQKLLISRKLEDSLGSAAVEQGIKELLIAEDQRVELMRECKDYMEVGGADDFRAALIGPDLI